MSQKNTFSPEAALNSRAISEEKAARRHQKQARNLANFAVRSANKGKLGISLPAKATRRFVPNPSGTHDPAIYPLANELLEKEGLGLENHTLGFGDPEDRIVVRVIPEQTGDAAQLQPQLPLHPGE